MTFEESLQEIGKELEALRNKQGFTQGDVFAESGIKQSSLSKLEAGNLTSLGLLRKYAAFFGKEVNLVLVTDNLTERLG